MVIKKLYLHNLQLNSTNYLLLKAKSYSGTVLETCGTVWKDGIDIIDLPKLVLENCTSKIALEHEFDEIET